MTYPWRVCRPKDIQLVHHGKPNDPTEFCDHMDADPEVCCNDRDLWAIIEDGVFVGLVCEPHRYPYLRKERGNA